MAVLRQQEIFASFYGLKIPNVLRDLMDLPYDPALPLLRTYPYAMKSAYESVSCTPKFIAAQFAIAKIQYQPRCSLIDDWIKKMYVYTVEYQSAVKHNEILGFLAANWIQSETIMLSAINESQKDIYQTVFPYL